MIEVITSRKTSMPDSFDKLTMLTALQLHHSATVTMDNFYMYTFLENIYRVGKKSPELFLSFKFKQILIALKQGFPNF